MRAVARKSRTVEWLDTFFTRSDRPDRPNGDPLFTYLVSEDEYGTLVETLRDTAAAMSYAGPTPPWSACFSLFVAEYYRREYEGPWTWADAETRIGVAFDQVTRQTLTLEGLDYWKRPLRAGESSNDYLGSLFSEGGLPWRQVSGGNRGFSRAVRAGLKHWHARESVGGDLVSHMARFDSHIPAAFQNPGTHELMAGIVTALMQLAAAVPLLASADDPIGLLDKRAAGWRSRFPVPLGQSNGRALVDSWLRAAAGERQTRQRAARENSEPRCRTALTGELPDWTLQTEVTLPATVDFDLNGAGLGSTRLVLTLHEGERLAASVGTLYGELDPAADRVRATLRDRQFGIERHAIGLPLTLHAYSDGVRVGRLTIEQSDIAPDDLPLVFDCDNDDWILVGATSTTIKNHCARVRLPAGCRLIGDPDHVALGNDARGGSWLELRGSVDIRTPSGTVRVRTGTQDAPFRPVLVGPTSCRDTLPGTTWLGWPTLELKDGAPLDLSELTCTVDGEPVRLSSLTDFVGCGVLVVRHPDHGTVLRRRIGVLPRDLRLSVLRATDSRPAQVVLATASSLRVGAEVDSTRTTTTATQDGYRIEMHPTRQELPTQLTLHIAGSADAAPVAVRLPYPGAPARLVGPDGIAPPSNDLVLDDLPGVRLLLTPEDTRSQTFHIDLELRGKAGRRLFTRRDYEVRGTPLSLPLDGLRDDIERMLSARSDLDGQVRVRVETNSVLCQFSVRRFAARLRTGESSDTLQLVDFDRRPVTGRNHALALRLSNPEETSVSVPERLSGGVGTGVLELPHKILTNGPWLIYPATESKAGFRPHIFGSAEGAGSRGPTTSLQRAAEQFDFRDNIGIIDTVVRQMTTDTNHSGWRYLAALASRHSHLPLSSFQAWKSVARCPHALVMALLKLDLGRVFARRFETELAVVWEEIPPAAWRNGIERLRRDLNGSIAVSSITEDAIRVRLELLSDLLPALTDFLVTLSNDAAPPQVPEEMARLCMTTWYQQLLRSRADDLWPDALREPLDRWYRDQALLPAIPALSVEHPFHVRPVCQLPLFMASLTAGHVRLTDLDPDEDAARFDIRQLSDFDRFWYESVYALALSLLVASPAEESR